MGKCSLDVTQLLLNNNQSVVKSAKIETELFLETLQSVRLGSLEKSSKMFKRVKTAYFFKRSNRTKPGLSHEFIKRQKSSHFSWQGQ